MRKLFGTDGIRGKANIYPIDAPTAYKVGVAVGNYFRQKGSNPRILIGRDTRISGNMLESAIISGLCAVGCEAVPLGVISTPGVAYLTHASDAAAGVVISASHNPFIDNGIKIFSKNGFKLPDQTELEIEDIILNKNMDDYHVAPHLVAKASYWKGAKAKYAEKLKSTMDGTSLNGLNIILDCANGASYKIAPDLFANLGAKVTAIGIEPDGTNINKACGSLHPERLQKHILEQKADLGVAFDGDADRAIFVDAKGNTIDGDSIMAIVANSLKQQDRLAKNTLVATVMSNIGLDRAMEKIGVNVVKTQVGDRYVVEAMREYGYNFGGEQSGHLIFLDHITSGDGMLTALQIVKIMMETGKSLAELASIMTRFPQVLKNLMVNYKRPLEELNYYNKLLSKITEDMGNDGRVLVRYSGTENKVRVMVEGMDEKKIKGYADELIGALDGELN